MRHCLCEVHNASCPAGRAGQATGLERAPRAVVCGSCLVWAGMEVPGWTSFGHVPRDLGGLSCSTLDISSPGP